ncbi:MAG TPA: DegQ family serine endoprotease [Burkholderiales bacterium]|nr:DegQ family serine endoprotease [Burkholderiales bacterium]
MRLSCGAGIRGSRSIQRQPFLALLLCLGLAVPLTVCAQRSAPAEAGGTERSQRGLELPSFSALVKREGATVVNVSGTQTVRGTPSSPAPEPGDPFYEFFRRFAPPEWGAREFHVRTLGSGFIVSRDGYILTNAHVVENAQDIVVYLTDKRQFKAKVVGVDTRTDIALLKVEATDLPVAVIGDPETLEVGDWVVAIGAPFGFTNSVTQGIVSAKGRALPDGGYVPFIQTDVPVNPGNSGGPLFNLKGEVVGINSLIFSRTGGYMGLSFAIPIDLAMKVKDELLKHGRIRRGRLGVSAQDVDERLAEAFGLSKPAGALVTSVDPGGPAARAGIESGDIILKLDGKDIASSSELSQSIAGTEPGKRVKLEVWHRNAVNEFDISLGEVAVEPTPQPPRARPTAPDRLGLTLRELTASERRELHTQGSLVVEDAAGEAAAAGIQPGDIVLAVNNTRVSTVKAFRAALQQARKTVALLIEREGDSLFIGLKLAEQ